MPINKIEIIRSNSGEVYTLFESGVAATHTKSCIIKRDLGINHVGIAPRELWEQLKQKYEVEILNDTKIDLEGEEE